ncbi:hypothetical protein IWX49DRAFT_249522 [Phyllosticta citricarpa]
MGSSSATMSIAAHARHLFCRTPTGILLHLSRSTWPNAPRFISALSHSPSFNFCEKWIDAPHRALRLLAICFIRSHSTEYSSRLPLSRWIPRAFPKAARKRLASRPWTSEWLVQGKQRIASAKPLSPANTTSDRLARHRMKTLWTRIDPDEQTTRPTGELGHHTSQVARSLPTGRRTVPQSVASLLHQRRLDWTLIARISAGNRRSKKQSCRPCRATKRPATLTPSRAGPSPRPMFLSHVGAGEKGHKMSKTRKSLFSIRFCPFALPGASFPGSAANLPA